MHRLTLPALLLALAAPSFAADGRSVVPLDTGWAFEGPSVDGSTLRGTVTLPHTWNATDALDGLEYARGVGTTRASCRSTRPRKAGASSCGSRGPTRSPTWR